MRRRLGSVLVAAALLVAGCDGGESARPTTDPFVAVESRAAADDERARSRAAPRWERVAVLRGDGPGSERVQIAADAVQWRMTPRCSPGRFAVTGGGRELVGGECRSGRRAAGLGRGPIALDVAATGRWRLLVEQQVTTATAEAPLPEVADDATRLLLRGRFEGIERRGRGTATIHRLADGRRILRLEGFATAANTDLAVWLSRARAPRTTRQALAAPHRKIADLTSTLGDQNYVLPPGVPLKGVRSVVIWCEPLRIAYAAAPLLR